MSYVVVENTPGYMPEDDDPFVGTWEDACEAMDDTIRFLVDQGYTVVANEGTGFRLPGGIRRTWLDVPEAHSHSLPRVVEVMPYES